MKSQKKWMVGIIVVLVLINVATLSSFWWMRKPHHPPHLEAFFKKELGLTDEQATQFKALQDAHKQKGHQLHDSVKLFRTALFEEALKGTENKVKVDSLVNEISRIEVVLNYNLINHFTDLGKLCNSDEQRKKLDAILKKSAKMPPPPPRK